MIFKGLALGVVVAACSKTAGPASTGSGSAVADANAIALPVVTHAERTTKARRADAYSIYRNDAWFAIDHDATFGGPESGGRALDERGRLTPAGADWVPARASGTQAASTVLIVAPTMTAAALRTALVPFAGKCFGFLVARDHKATSLMPDPCPTQAPAIGPDTVDLGVWVDTGKIRVGLSRVNEVEDLADLAHVESWLRDRKASTFFQNRNDLTFALHADATVAEVMALYDLIYAAGFTGARWVEPKHLRVKLGDGIGTEPG